MALFIAKTLEASVELYRKKDLGPIGPPNRDTVQPQPQRWNHGQGGLFGLDEPLLQYRDHVKEDANGVMMPNEPPFKRKFDHFM